MADIQSRAARFAGRQREHTPTIADPFTVVLVDEVAFLTAYQPDRTLKERIMLALATLTTQGRRWATRWWPRCRTRRKDVLTIRNLFPDRIAMRLDEPEQVDMVLGDGGLAAAHPRCFGNRPGPVRLGTRSAVRPGSPGSCPPDAPWRR